MKQSIILSFAVMFSILIFNSESEAKWVVVPGENKGTEIVEISPGLIVYHTICSGKEGECYKKKQSAKRLELSIQAQSIHAQGKLVGDIQVVELEKGIFEHAIPIFLK